MKTKNNKRFLSLIIAVSMVLTSFAGLTITTADAEGEPTLSSWNFTDYYTSTFDYADGNASDVNADANNAWEAQSGRNFDTNGGYRLQDKTIKIKWTRYMQYVIPEAGKTNNAFAFRYTIAAKAVEERYVSIVDETDTTVDIITNDAITTEEKIYTTVVDGKQIYTYDASGKLLSTKTFTGDTIKAIRFGNTTNSSDFNFYICDFAYMTEQGTGGSDEPALNSWNFTDYYTSTFDYADGNASDVNADANNAWEAQSGRNFDTNGGYRLQDKTIKIKWTRYMQYVIPEAGKTNNAFAFRYTIAAKAVEERYVSIVDETDTTVDIITNDAITTEEKIYTTVVDGKQIYTYDASGKLLSTKTFTGDTIKAIRFGNTTNSSDFNFYICDFAYMTETAEALTIGIDYEKAQLTGFTEGDTYTVAVGESGTDESVTVKTGGVVDIDSKWYSATDKLTIKKTGTELSAEVGPLGAQPSAPAMTTDYIITNAAVGSTNGNVKAADAEKKLEYYDEAQEKWAVLDTTGVTVETGNSLSIRTKGSNTNETFP
ncbi:MAG: hypothetical protein ACI4C7_08605, partial [Clostridia bacterium]